MKESHSKPLHEPQLQPENNRKLRELWLSGLQVNLIYDVINSALLLNVNKQAISKCNFFSWMIRKKLFENAILLKKILKNLTKTNFSNKKDPRMKDQNGAMQKGIGKKENKKLLVEQFKKFCSYHAIV